MASGAMQGERSELFELQLHATPISGPDSCSWILASRRLTLTALLADMGWKRPPARTRIFVGGAEIPRDFWPWVRPRAGVRVVAVGCPAEPASLAAIGSFFASVGGAIASATASLAGIIGSTIPGAYAIGGTAAAAAGALGAGGLGVTAAYIGGTIIGGAAIVAGVNAIGASLMDAPSQDMGRTPGSASPTLEGQPNSARPNSPFPYVFGDVRGVPPFGAFPYSVIRGTESEAMFLFLLGPGPVKIDADDIMIGEVPLSSFSGIEYEIREGRSTDGPLSLYTNRVFQTAINNVMEPIFFDDPMGIGEWLQVPVAGTGHGKIGFDLNFVQGIGRIAKSGNSQRYSVGLQVQYRKNAGSWIEATTLSSFSKLGTARPGAPTHTMARGNSIDIVHFTGETQKPFQVGFEWSVGGVADDQFDIRMRRVETLPAGILKGSGGSVAIYGTIVWYSVKGYDFSDPPILEPGIATVELRFPVNEQFRGITSNFSVRARREARIYDPGGMDIDADGWTNGTVETRNPSALIRDALQGPGNIKPRPDSQLDVEAFSDFYAWCDDFNDGGSGPLCFDLFHDFGEGTSLQDLCRTIAAAGLGRFGRDSRGRFTVTFDAPKSNPVAMVNAASVRGFRMQVLFPREVHAIRAQFQDRTAGFDPNAERLVYNDGFSKDNADPGKIEDIRFLGITDPKLIYVHARRRIAERALRRRIITTGQDLEHLGYGIGDLVLLSHPGALVGSHWGRVKSTSSARYRDTFEADPAPYGPVQRDAIDSTLEIRRKDVPATHGAAVARLTSAGADPAIFAQPFDLAIPQNWTGLRLRIDAHPVDAAALSSGDGLRLRLYGPSIVDWAEWHFGSSDGLAAGAWALASVALGTDTPDDSAGTFSASTVVRAEFLTNVVSPQAGRIWYFDNFRVDSASSEICEITIDQSVDLRIGVAASIDHRRIDSGAEALAIQTLTLRGLPTFGVASDRTVPAVYLSAPIASGTTEPMAGDLVTIGTSVRVICHSKEPGSDFTATVTFVDEGEGIQGSATSIPAFAPTTNALVPLNVLGPGKPTIVQVVADERALIVTRDGSLRPAIRIDLEPSSSRARPQTAAWSVKYRRRGSSSFTSLPSVELSPHVVIESVDELQIYDVVIQAIDSVGRASESVTIEVNVTGKTNLPPSVEDFRIEGNLLRWSLDDLPIDLAGFEIRRGGTGSTFETSRRIHGPMYVAAPPFDLSQVDPGFARLHIKATDFAGNQSAQASTLEAFVGAIPEQNQIDVYDVALAGFPIIDQIDSVLSGFENLHQKETPDTSTDIVYPPEDMSMSILSLEAIDDEMISVESEFPLNGTRSLRVISNSASFGAVITYRTSVNREGSGIRVSFYGDKSATWTLSVRLIDATDPDAWVRFDQSGISGLLESLVSIPDISATPTATGSSGPCNFRTIGAIEISATDSSFAVGDSFYIDDLEWIGGALNGVVLDGEDLVNQEQGDPYWPEDDSLPFWGTDDGALFWQDTNYFSGIYEFEATPDEDSIPCDLRIELNSDVGVDYFLEYKVGDRFVTFPGLIPVASTDPLRFRVRLAGGIVQGRITDLKVIYDVPDEREFVASVTIGASGTQRIAVSKSYREIRIVQIALLNAGSGKSWKLIDKDPINGPSIEVYDFLGIRVSENVDAFIEGVKGQ